MKFVSAFLACVLLSNAQLVLAQYTVSNDDASVEFGGEHAGMKFSGVFEKWNAEINLPDAADDNQNAYIKANFDVSSAKTGDLVYDETLPEGDWFDVKNHPKGVFESSSITETEQGFDVKGTLTLRGKKLETSFTLKKNDGRLTASFPIDRLAYGIGLDSDPEAEWVSQFIQMKIDIPQS